MFCLGHIGGLTRSAVNPRQKLGPRVQSASKTEPDDYSLACLPQGRDVKALPAMTTLEDPVYYDPREARVTDAPVIGAKAQPETSPSCDEVRCLLTACGSSEQSVCVLLPTRFVQALEAHEVAASFELLGFKREAQTIRSEAIALLDLGVTPPPR
jgi:hypothetical protein